jgi:hypothetical protein
MFRAVGIGTYGRNADSGVFTNSKIWEKLSTNTLNIPPPTPLEEGGESVNYIFVGDEA